MPRHNAPRLIADSTYWLGSVDNTDSRQTNIYLIYRRGQGIIIDPGPRSVFRETLAALREIAPLEEVRALLISGQDPDVCSSLPSWEEAGFQGRILCNSRTEPILKAYGLLSPLSPVKEGENGSLPLFPDLEMIPLSYQTAPGLLLSLDRRTGTLFSSHLFESFGERYDIFADDAHFAGMTSFISEFFSSPGEIGETAEMLSSREIGTICPQHGCIIAKKTDRYIAFLGGAGAEKEKPSGELAGKDADWEKISFDLNEELVLSMDGKMLDPVTGLYNAAFYHNFLPEFIRLNPGGVLAFFRIDGMKVFNNLYGFQEGDRVIATFAHLLQGSRPEDAYLFREAGPIVILMLPRPEGTDPLRIIEEMQNRVRESQDFIQDMTCSVALAHIDEVPETSENREEQIIRLIRNRLQLLDSLGDNAICSSSDIEEETDKNRTILIFDADPVCSRLLHDFLTSRGFTVHYSHEGGEALHLIDLYRPDMIISETMIPQLDGFRIRELMRQSRDLRNIPFIFLSHLKSEDTVERAQKLGVYHYFKKPVMLTELLGIIRFRIRGEG